MKKTLLLLLLLPFLFLFGCGGSGIDSPTADGSGGIPGGGTGGGSNVAGLQNVTVYIPPYQGAAQKALVDNILIPNAVRLVATHSKVIGKKCIQFITATGVDPDEGPYTTTECNDPFKKKIGTPGVDEEIVFTTDPPTPNPAAYQNIYGIVAEAISDGQLDGSGSGTVGIAVPPGVDYTLHVLTFVTGDFIKDPGDNDTFNAVAALIGPNGRIVMGTNTRNIIREYGKSAEFDLAAGEEKILGGIILDAPATLILPVTPVTAGDSYPVEADMSDCLADNWYIQQLLDQADQSDQWFISEGGDIDGTASSNIMELDSEIVTGQPAPRIIWHFAQFFISSDLVAPGESWTRWSYCTTDAGELNPWGEIIVTQ